MKIDFPSEAGEEQIETENVGYYEERTFSWQEKIRRNSSESVKEDNEDESKVKNDDWEHKPSRQRILSYVDKDNYDERKSITTDTSEDSIETRDTVDDVQKMFIVVDMNDYKRLFN